MCVRHARSLTLSLTAICLICMSVSDSVCRCGGNITECVFVCMSVCVLYVTEQLDAYDPLSFYIKWYCNLDIVHFMYIYIDIINVRISVRLL